jgi:hypothetical protein
MKRQSRFIMQNTSYHPDYTVGPGVSPDHALRMQFVFSKLPTQVLFLRNARGLYHRSGIAAQCFSAQITLPRSIAIQLSK